MPTEAPEQITARNLADYLDVLTKAVFQSGISWRVVEAKWAGTREAFRGFDPERVAGLSPTDIEHLATDSRLIRHRRKIEATVANADTLIALDRAHGGFKKYLRSFPTYDALQADLVKQFRYLGDTGAYYFLHVVKEKVPPHDEWMATYKPAGFTRKRRVTA